LFSLSPRAPLSPLFPYTTLFRSRQARRQRGGVVRRRPRPELDRERQHADRLDLGLLHRGEQVRGVIQQRLIEVRGAGRGGQGQGDRKSTRLNSSHSQISYAVFCL